MRCPTTLPHWLESAHPGNSKFSATTAQIPVPKDWYSQLHVDIVRPLPAFHICTHLLMCIDHTPAGSHSVVIYHHQCKCMHIPARLVGRFGIPHKITSNWDMHLIFTLWRATACLLGNDVHHRSTHHLQSNRLVKHFQCMLKATL